MSERRDIDSLISELTSQGGRVRLKGAEPEYSLASYQGSRELLDELGLRQEEVVGFLALLRPRRILPVVRKSSGPPPSGVSCSQRQWSDPTRSPLQEQWLPVVWKLEGLLNTDAMKASFSRLLERHGILRTGFVGSHDAIAAKVFPVTDFPLELVDLTPLPAGDREREIWKRMRLKYEGPTSLEHGVVDLKLYRIAERTHVLAGFIHHIAMDAASLGVTLGELMARYYGGLFGKETGEEEPLQYADFVRWEQAWLTDDERRLSDSMWRYQLAAAVIPRALDRPEAQRRDDYEVATLALPKDVYDAAVSSAKTMGATLNIYFLAALSIALGNFCEQCHALFGLITSGRPPGFDRVIGSFIQLRPFFLSFGGDETFGDVLKRARKMYATSSDLGRPASLRVLDQFGADRIVVNYTRRGEGSSEKNKTPARGASITHDREVRGVFTTTTNPLAAGIADRPPPSTIPAFFSAASAVSAYGALSQPSPTELSVQRRAAGLPGPRRMLGLSASMARLPERLQTEFHRDLHFAMVQSGTNLGGVLTYSRQAISSRQAIRLCDTIVGIIAAAARDPLLKVSSLIGAPAAVAPPDPETA